MENIISRGSLDRLKEAIKNKKATIGYTGGSITDGQDPAKWPAIVRGWFCDKFPDVKLTHINSAIGATGSLCGLSIAKSEYIDMGCDLVMIEYAVNDSGVDRDERQRTREGLIRKFLSEGIDVILVYTMVAPMINEMKNGDLPLSIADMEVLAEHYNISSVFMGNAALELVQKGIISLKAWLPDSVHPDYLGSSIYGQEVVKFLEKELSEPNDKKQLKGNDMPKPLNDKNWQFTEEIDFDRIKLNGSWAVERELFRPMFPFVLRTYGLGDSIEFEFEGRGLAMIMRYGTSSGTIHYSIDGGEPVCADIEVLSWMLDDAFIRTVKLADDLPYGKHTFKLWVDYWEKDEIFSADCKILKIYAAK